jgi:hypothetical protein
MANADTIRPPGLRAWHVAAAIAATALLALVAILFVLPRFSFFREWRSGQIAREAELAMDSADWARAHAKTIAAFQLAPENPAALRAAARLNAAAGMPQALGFYRTLLATGKATGDDYLHYSDSLLRSGSYPPFLAAVSEASNRLPDDPRVQLLLARYALAANDWPAAEKILSGIMGSARAKASDRSLAAQILLSVPLPSARTAAAKWLLDNPPDGKPDPKLLDAILATPGVPEDLLHRAASAVESLPGRNFEGRIETAASTIRANPDERDEVFDRLTRDAKTLDEKRLLASFFVRMKENQRALSLLPLMTARTRRDLFLVWLDASAGLGRWDDIINLLKSSQNPLEPALRELYIARCHEALGQEKLAEIGFERAAKTPTEDRDLLFYLAGYFNQRNRPGLAELVLRRLTSDPLAARSAYEALLNIERLRGDSAGLLGILEEMHRRWPKDPAVSNDRNYLLLLTGRDISRTLERARVLEQENPDLFPLKMTRALALLRAGSAAEGLGIFEKSNVQFGQLLPGQKAVFSALLDANGMSEAAASVRAGIAPGTLLPEEKALLEK